MTAMPTAGSTRRGSLRAKSLSDETVPRPQ
jgi:hypothetical protein